MLVTTPYWSALKGEVLSVFSKELQLLAQEGNCLKKDLKTSSFLEDDELLKSTSTVTVIPCIVALFL